MKITPEAKSAGKFAKTSRMQILDSTQKNKFSDETGGVHAYRKAVFIVVYRKEGKKIFYLVLRRKLHWLGWEFPKGGIERKETEIQTVKRELKEETGQKSARILKFKEKGRYKYRKINPDRPNIIGQEYRLFAAEINNKKIKLDKKEHSSYKWLKFNQALKILDFPEKKKSLKIVNDFLINLSKHTKPTNKPTTTN